VANTQTIPFVPSPLIAAMNLEQSLCFYLSSLELMAVCVLPPMLLSIVGLSLFRKAIPFRFLKQSHDVTGPFFSTLGTVYGIFLAFVFTVTWQAYSTTSTNVVQEARYLRDLYFVTKAFPQPTQGELQQLLREYRNSVVNDEWKTMQKGEASPRTIQLLQEIGAAYLRIKPNNEQEKDFFRTSISYLTTMNSLRASRIDDSSSGLPPVLWFVLLVGAVATIGLSYLFEAQNFWLQAILTILLTGVICMTFCIIIDLDFPFTGGTTISAESFQSIEMN
jgi:hypothetical protein